MAYHNSNVFEYLQMSSVIQHSGDFTMALMVLLGAVILGAEFVACSTASAAVDHLRIAYLEIESSLTLSKEGHLEGHLASILSSVLLKLNYKNMTFIDGYDAGTMDETGNYGGMIGLLQRNEADFSILFVPSLPGDPVNLSPPLRSEEVSSLSKRIILKYPTDILSQFSSCNIHKYMITFMCTVIITLSLVRRLEVKVNKRLSPLSLGSIGWSISRIALSNSNFSSQSKADRVLVAFYLLVVFFLIVLLGGEIGTNNTVSTEIKINSADDLMSRPEVASVWIKMSKLGSIVREKYRTLWDNRQELTFEQIPPIVASLKGAFIDNKDTLSLYADLICQADPYVKLWIAKRSMFTVAEYFGYNKNLSLSVKSKLDYLSRIMLEGALLKHPFAMFRNTIVIAEENVCMSVVKDEGFNGVFKLKVSDFVTLFLLSLFFLTFASFILFLENARDTLSPYAYVCASSVKLRLNLLLLERRVAKRFRRDYTN